MIAKRFVEIIVCLFLLTGVSLGTARGVFESDQRRERLKYRVQLFSNYDRQKEYGNLYSLLAKEQRDGYGSEEKFIDFKKTADQTGELLMSFSAKSLQLDSSRTDAVIVGCGKYLNHGKTRHIESQVEAVYESGDWYFRSLIGVSSGFGSEPKKCR